MDRDPRPVIVAGATAVVSCGLLAVAVGRGWLGPDVGRGANFCEAARAGFVRQPANTFSNVGFVTAGLLIAWHAGGREGTGGRGNAGGRDGTGGRGNTGGRDGTGGRGNDGGRDSTGGRGNAGGRDGIGPMRPPLATAMAVLVVLLGPGSAAMHATQSEAGGHLDMLSMYLVASFAASYALMRWRRGGAALLAAGFVAGIVVCELVGAWDVSVPVVNHPGNATFGLMLVAATVLEVLIMRRPEVSARRGYIITSLAAILTAFVIWNATRTWLCDPYSSIQGHAIWHLLGAVAAYFLYRYYASETRLTTAVGDPGRTVTRGSWR